MNDTTQILHNYLCDLVGLPYNATNFVIRETIRERGRHAVMASSVDSCLLYAAHTDQCDAPLNAISWCARACGYAGVGPALAWRDLEKDCESAIFAKRHVDKLGRSVTVSA
ncbi:hypothetical protein UFOVP75_25 [uncultured Caudovirales phage]|uniref:Uncharacterized protein n=1 Tax=uncultured Caudovirales phage TaxID=2100421 RepID=A0A6J5KXC5_9CAUD|nr:hypothetical protein UFOVP75_25 [uncultured Caudovirales phage]